MRRQYARSYLQTIADSYDAVGEITDCRAFTSGFENSNYYIETGSGRYVIKIFEGRGRDAGTIAYEAEAMNASHLSGVKTPRVLANALGSLVTSAEDKSVILMEYIDGENISGQRVSDSLIEEIGEEMGKMDTALSDFSKPPGTRQEYEFDLKNFPGLYEEVALLPPRFEHAAFEDVFASFAGIEEAFRASPAGLIHNDVVKHNLLVKDSKLSGIVDFSDMAFSPYAQNIAVTLSQVVFSEGWETHQSALLIRGYRKQRAFSDEEASFLYDLTRARRAQLVLAFSKWNRELGDDQERTDAMERSYGFMLKLSHLGRATFNEFLSL